MFGENVKPFGLVVRRGQVCLRRVGPVVRVTVRRYQDDADVEIELSRREADGLDLHYAKEVGIRIEGGATYAGT